MQFIESICARLLIGGFDESITLFKKVYAIKCGQLLFSFEVKIKYMEHQNARNSRNQ